MPTPDSFRSNYACIAPIDLNPSALDAPGHFLQDAFGFATFYKKGKKLRPLNYLLSSSIEQLSEIYENKKNEIKKFRNFLTSKFSRIFIENCMKIGKNKIKNRNFLISFFSINF